MGDCNVGDFLLVFLLLAILHNGLSDGFSDDEVPIHRTNECLQLYSKPTGNEGDTLVIGSKSNYESVNDVFPGFDHESCAPMKSEDYNVNNYGTNIFKRSNSNHFDVPVKEQLQEVTATDYFIQVGVQAFNCEVRKDGTGELKRYKKIVNSMSSIQDNIREIKYYSGVSVSIEECGGRKCIQVTETKCMAELEGGQGLVQFKCDYAIQRPANPPIIVPNMQVKHLKRDHLKTSLGYQYLREGVSTVTISEEGKSFRIGINENPSGIVPKAQPTFPEQRNMLKVACQPPIINPTIFYPECYQKVKNEEDNSFKDVLLNDTQFRKSFTVVDETVQICKEMNGDAPDSSQYPRVFYHVQMTVIGKTKVNNITHGTGITELYSINIADGAVTVRYTDMRFYDAITRKSVDNLYYRNVFPSDMKVFITSNSAPVTHTPSDTKATPRSLDVDYKLWPEGIYSTFISGDGYNLLVGSKPKLDIDFGTASCRKVDYSNDHFKTELKIIAEKGGEFYAHPTDYCSRPIQQQSWRCEYFNKYNEKRSYFTRVVNHLEILVPVHTMQSYDGVEILRRPSAEKYILEIFEVKYLLENLNKSEEHSTTMRAYGEISFATDDRPTDTDTAYAMGQGFNAISKSEVHPRFINQIPKTVHYRNDYRGKDGELNKPFTGLFVTVHIDETPQVYYSDGNRGREYRFHLPGNQSSKEWQGKRMMRIGESYRVQQEIRLTSEALQCRENYTISRAGDSDDRLRTLVQTFKYSSQGNAAELEQTYHGYNPRVWECTGGQITILRVMNNFCFSLTEFEKIRTILYSDGIAIFSGEDYNNTRIFEIAEVKFLNAVDYTNLKYEGALEFESSSIEVGPKPIELKKPEIQDVNYILNDNEFSKTAFPAVLGDTLEIGSPSPGIKSHEDKEGTRFQKTIKCYKLVKESSLTKEVRDNVMKPKVILLQRRDEKKEKEILPSTITDLKLYFDDIGKKIWNCIEKGTFSTNLYRVQTQMKLKPNIKIQHIFHQNGVKIYEDYNGRHLIEITSYFEERTIGNFPSAFVPVKFEGLVALPLEVLEKKFMNDKTNSANHLDKPIFQFSALSRETGVTYLVESEFHSTIDNSGGEIVTCVKYEDKNTAQETYMQTKILVNENSNTQTPTKTWNEVDHTSTDHILYESYEKWSCKYQENDFTRVVNKMLMKDNARVYYPHGVEVQRLILLNGRTVMQIKHVRFFKSEHGESHAIKYIGRLQLERPSLPGLEKMLSSPPFNIQVMGKQEEEPSPYQPSYIFTLDSMRYAALLDLGKRSEDLNQSSPIEFNSQVDFLQTKYFNAKSSRIFQLGRFWNEELNSKGTIKCYVYSTANLRVMKYIISPEDAKTKYNPRVAENIDQKLYILTQDEFDEIFTITRMRTWFCTDNTDEFLKVETFYETAAIPFAVRSTDGVEVKLERVGNEELLKIRETVYINMMNSRVYKRNQNPDRKQEDLLEYVIPPDLKIRRNTRQKCLGFLKGLLPHCGVKTTSTGESKNKN